MYSKEGMYMENNEDKLLDEQINKIINDDSSNNFSNNQYLLFQHCFCNLNRYFENYPVLCRNFYEQSTLTYEIPN